MSFGRSAALSRSRWASSEAFKNLLNPVCRSSCRHQRPSTKRRQGYTRASAGVVA